MTRTILSACVSLAALSGCASGQLSKDIAPIRKAAQNGDYVPVGNENAAVAAELAGWERIPAVTVVRLPADTMVPTAMFSPLSSEMRGRTVDIRLETGSTYAELVTALNNAGVSALVESDGATAPGRLPPSEKNSPQQGAQSPNGPTAPTSQQQATAPSSSAIPGAAGNPAIGGTSSAAYGNGANGPVMPNSPPASVAKAPRDIDVGGTEVPFSRHNGTVGQLADRIEASSDFSVSQVGRAIMISRRLPWTFRLSLRDATFAKALTDDLAARGATDIGVSQMSGEIIYTAPAKTQRTVILPFLERARANLAMVGIQVALVNVTGTGSHNRGVDWSKFQIAATPTSTFNSLVGGYAAGGTPPSVTNGYTVNGTAAFPGVEGSVSSTGNTVVGGAGLLATGSSIVSGGTIPVSLLGQKMTLGLAGAVAVLDSAGVGSVKQNVELRTLSGIDVSMRDGPVIPYVATIGVTTTGATASNGTTASLGSVTLATVKTGLTLKFSPVFDAGTGLITVGVDLTNTQLDQTAGTAGMIPLSAGNQYGTVTQPQIQKHKLESIVSGRAGDVALLDGTRLATVNRTSQSPLGGPLPYESEIGTNSSLFVIFRSSVTRYEIDGAPHIGNEGAAPVPVAERFAVPPAERSAETRKVTVRRIDGSKPIDLDNGE